MDDNDLFELMNDNGFKDQEIKIVLSQPVRKRIALLDVLMEVSYSFPKVIKMHLILLCIVGYIITLDYRPR